MNSAAMSRKTHMPIEATADQVLASMEGTLRPEDDSGAPGPLSTDWDSMT